MDVEKEYAKSSAHIYIGIPSLDEQELPAHEETLTAHCQQEQQGPAASVALLEQQETSLALSAVPPVPPHTPAPLARQEQQGDLSPDSMRCGASQRQRAAPQLQDWLQLPQHQQQQGAAQRELPMQAVQHAEHAPQRQAWPQVYAEEVRQQRDEGSADQPRQLAEQQVEQRPSQLQQADEAHRWHANPLAPEPLRLGADPPLSQTRAALGLRWQAKPLAQQDQAALPALDLPGLAAAAEAVPPWQPGQESVKDMHQQRQQQEAQEEQQRHSSTLRPALRALPIAQQEECFFWLLEELAVGSADQWRQVQEALQQGYAADERYRAVLPAQREALFGQYTALQAELERKVEETVGRPWHELQAEAATSNLLVLHSPQLQLLPASVGRLAGLHMLNLRGCSSLQRLPASLALLDGLQFLELADCKQLRRLPPNLGALLGLQTLDLSGCAALRELPASLGQLESLQTLDFSCCAALEHLPGSLPQLAALQTLNLRGCGRLRRLPDAFGRLASLQWLDCSGCAQLQHLPADLGQLGSLCALELANCAALRELPSSLGQLGSLINLTLSGCEQLRTLPASLGQLRCLQRLYLSGCSRLQALPATVGELGSLQTLDLSGCTALQGLPPLLGQLGGLKSLNLSGCASLASLPDLGGCADLELSMSDRLPSGQAVDMRRIRVPFDHLPPPLQRQHPEFLLNQADALRQSMTSISWIAVLLATASFVGFVTVPGGYLDLGLVQLALKKPKINRSALRSYFIANIVTFFMALGTAVFCASENMPHAVPPTAGRAVFSIVASTVLLFMTLAAGASTFLSGALAVYPASQYGDLIPAAAAAGAILVLAFWWYSRHVWSLFFHWRRLRRSAPFPHLLVTGPVRHTDVQKVLKAILLK